MKILKIVLAVVLATGLVIALALPGLAAARVKEYQGSDYQLSTDSPDGDKAPRQLLRGKVVKIDEDESFFVIQQGEEEPITISVDNGTQYLKMSAPRLSALPQRVGPRNEQRLKANQVRPVTSANPGRPNQARLMKRGRANQAGPAVSAKPGRANQARLMNRGKANQAGPAVSAKLRRANQAQLMNRGNGFAQQVSRPMATPEPTVAALEPTMGEGEIKEKPGPWNPQRFRRFGEKATFDDIEIGDKVSVRIVPGQEESLARLVLIFEPSVYQRVTGTITAISVEEKTITIDPTNDDEAVTLNYNDDTTFILKGTIALAVGQSVSVVYYGEDLIAKMVRVNSEGE